MLVTNWWTFQKELISCQTLLWEALEALASLVRSVGSSSLALVVGTLEVRKMFNLAFKF